jgi:hypothetical protein
VAIFASFQRETAESQKGKASKEKEQEGKEMKQ